MTKSRAYIQSALQLLASHPVLVLSVVLSACAIYEFIYKPLFNTPLRHIPGPKLYALTKWRLALADWQGQRTPTIHEIHEKYGPAVRIGPNEVSFSSLSALRTIYGAGSGFERTDFYRMFDVYGRQNLFTFASAQDHGERKKVLAHAYSKSAILSPTGISKLLIENNVKKYLDLVDRGHATEIFRSLHWFSLDSITGFLYGQKHGGTSALMGDESSRRLLDDILDPTRKKLTWFAVHLKVYTKWLYSRTGLAETIVTKLGLLPMQKPSTYTGIRAHALSACQSYEAAPSDEKSQKEEGSIMEKLWKYQQSGKHPRMDRLDIASEAADHFLAGIDTTSDTLMFLIWQLSRPENSHIQQKLILEVDATPESALNKDGNPTAEVADKLEYLDALIKETLRLHAPLPASEPRSLPTDTEIDGYEIPAGTVVGMSPYTLHRNPEVFPEPLKFKPERWLGELGDPKEMKKWFWAFSSGGRMCIGVQFVAPLVNSGGSLADLQNSLAMAEMTTLVAALYRRYTTTLHQRQSFASPGITSRFEVFYDETCDSVKEHECWIDFQPREL